MAHHILYVDNDYRGRGMIVYPLPKSEKPRWNSPRL